MSVLFVIRLILDFAAFGLFVAGLAYWWLGNAVHELIGTAMFVLLIAHTVFNRRWYAKIPRTVRSSPGRASVLLNLSLLLSMLALLLTSVLISQTLLGSLGLNVGYTVVQIHTLAAYWTMVIVALHLGLQWAVVMNVLRNVLRLQQPDIMRVTALRLAAAALAAYGVWSSFEMGIGSRLIGEVSPNFWDFEESTLGFFINHLAIASLYASIAHYGMMVLRRATRKRTGREIAGQAR